jgi:hypothetical protein
MVSTGRRLVYNRFLDVLLGVAAFVTSLDALSVDIGVALTSLLAVGGLGSVIVALACKEPLTHFISGLMVTFSDKFMVSESFGILIACDTHIGIDLPYHNFLVTLKRFNGTRVGFFFVQAR